MKKWSIEIIKLAVITFFGWLIYCIGSNRDTAPVFLKFLTLCVFPILLWRLFRILEDQIMDKFYGRDR